jgi:hypothetical protein
VTCVAIMQPYFLPYIGYFQLIHAADCFVVYDNIKYTKKGWINRNRLLKNGTDSTFSLPLQHGSDTLDVRDRSLSPDFNRSKFLNQFRESYRRAPYFAQVWPVLERIVMDEEASLFGYIHHSIGQLCAYLGVTTPVVVSSTIDIDHELKSQDKVLAICGALGATRYINAIGGQTLYSGPDFEARGIELRFLQSQGVEYPQFDHRFVPWLSIIDVLMFNRVETVRDMLDSWTPVADLAMA